MANLTLADIKDQVYSRLEDNREMYQDQEVTDAINEAYRIMSMFCGWVNRTSSISSGYTIADRTFYDVPDDIIFPQKVDFEGQALEKVSLFSMSQMRPSWVRETTANSGRNVSQWVPIGIRKIAIHPADSVGGGLLQVTGIGEPVQLVNDTDIVLIPKEGVLPVCDYAAHSVQCKLQGAPFMDSLEMYRNFENLMKLSKYWQGYRQPSMIFLDKVDK